MTKMNGSATPGGAKTNAKQVMIALAAIIMISVAFLNYGCSGPESQPGQAVEDTSINYVAELMGEEKVWLAPDVSTIPAGEEGQMIRYGRTLIVHTSKYYGPKGSINHSTNGMNCQNCHLDAGTKPYGNNLGAVTSTYPKFMPRFGAVQSVPDKVNDCFTRSMNGDAIDTAGKEMTAIIAYLDWLGKDVKKGETPVGSGGIKAPQLIDRAADPANGKLVYTQFCARCHGADGQGQFTVDVMKDPAKQQGGTATAEDLYYYPPLWGAKSFNGVATLYRLSKFAGFVQHNMPYPIDFKNTVLTDEQAWDVAAYVNSLDRPIKDHSKDYVTDISKKPFDFPFGPFADNFPELQHKFGPYKDMPSAKHKK